MSADFEIRPVAIPAELHEQVEGHVDLENSLMDAATALTEKYKADADKLNEQCNENRKKLHDLLVANGVVNKTDRYNVVTLFKELGHVFVTIRDENGEKKTTSRVLN